MTTDRVMVEATMADADLPKATVDSVVSYEDSRSSIVKCSYDFFLRLTTDREFGVGSCAFHLVLVNTCSFLTIKSFLKRLFLKGQPLSGISYSFYSNVE